MVSGGGGIEDCSDSERDVDKCGSSCGIDVTAASGWSVGTSHSFHIGRGSSWLGSAPQEHHAKQRHGSLLSRMGFSSRRASAYAQAESEGNDITACRAAWQPSSSLHPGLHLAHQRQRGDDGDSQMCADPVELRELKNFLR